MSLRAAPGDPARSRRLRALARGLHWAHAQPTAPEASPGWLRLSVAATLLGLPSGLLARARHADAFEEVAGRVRVLHGRSGLLELHLWAAIDVARLGASESQERRSAIALRLHTLAADLGMVRRVAAALEDYGSGDQPEVALNQVEVRAAAWLGLRESFQRGRVPDLDLDYPVAYRLALVLGELRAAHLLEATGVEARLERELGPALDLLGLSRCLPEGLVELEPVGPSLWGALDAYLEVGVGGLADAVYRAGHDKSVLAVVPFRGLTFRRALGGLQQTTRRFRASTLVAELDALALAVESESDPHAEPPSAVAARVGRWLEAELPTDGLGDLERARIQSWAHRFQGCDVPVYAERIERFLDQFPGELRWVGEGLLDAVELRTRAQVAASQAFVLRSFGLSNAPGGCVLVGAPDDFWDDLRQEGLRLPRRQLSSALADPGFRTLIYVDDAVVTGGRAEAAWSDLLDGLSAEERAQLAERDVVVVVALATQVGLDHLHGWFEEQGLRARILAGKVERLLSELGREELVAGSLYDEDTGSMTQPTVQLAAPLFSVHEAVWRGRDPRVARELCTEIGAALIGAHPDAASWSGALLRGAALGVGGLQGRWVFGHRVPESTVSLLWCDGEWQGRPWLPLFAEPDEEEE